MVCTNGGYLNFFSFAAGGIIHLFAVYFLGMVRLGSARWNCDVGLAEGVA